MRTEIQKQYLRENKIDENAQGEDIEQIFTWPRYLSYVKKQKELNNQEDNQKMPQDFNEALEESKNQPVAQAAPVVASQVPKEEVAQQEQSVPQEPVAAPVAPAQPMSEFGALDSSGQIEKQKFDPTPHIGKDSFIEYIEERKGQYGFYIKLFSQVVDSGDWEIRATAIYGLEEDNEGRLGWPPDSKLYNFLKKFNLTHYRDLMTNPTTAVLVDEKGESYRRISGGMKTQIKIQTRQAKDGKEYLTF